MALARFWTGPGFTSVVNQCRKPQTCTRLRIVGRRQVSSSAYTRSPTVPASVNTAPYVETVDVQLSRDALPISSFNRYRALVLDTSYRPIDIVNWQRAICLDLFDKRDNRGRISLTRRNLLLRDSSTCQYCGCTTDLTVDHITPVSKGGLWEWSNLVTACNTCNGRKGSKTLKQLGWKLKKMPTAPSSWQVGILVGPEVNVKCTPKEWADYLFPGHKEAACPPAPVAQLDPLLSSI